MKKNKIIKKLFLLVPITFGIFILSSCTKSSVINVEFTTDNNVVYAGDFDLSDYKIKVSYRNGKSEEITVDETMIDENDIFKLYTPGTYDIKFYYDNFYTTTTFIVNINHFSDDIKFITNDVVNNEPVFVQNYDGKSHSLELTNNIPTGTEVIYPDGNSFVESKNTPYVVKAILTKEGYEDKEITGKMYIRVSNYPIEDLENIKFESLTTAYDGRVKTIEATDVKENLKVEYKLYDSTGKKVENAVDAGVYTVNATFTCTNHNYIIPEEYITKTATLTITQLPINTNTFTVESVIKSYDGETFEARTLGLLPDGVSYQTNIYDSKGEEVLDPKDVGIYTIKLTFITDKNHYAVPSSTTGTLTINRRVVDMSNVTYGLEEVKYDGNEKRYSLLDSQLESYIKANYEYYLVGQDIPTTPVNPGKYIVKISYEIINDNLDNYELINIPTNNAILVIDVLEGGN